MQDLSKDIERNKNSKSTEFEEGFDSSIDDDPFDSFFDDIDESVTGANIQGSDDNSGFGTFGNSGFGNNNTFGNNGLQNSAFGTFGPQNNTIQQNNNVGNRIAELGNLYANSAIDVIIAAIKNIRYANNSEVADIFDGVIKTSAIMIASSLILIVTGAITGKGSDGLIVSSLIAGIAGLGSAIIGMGICSAMADKNTISNKINNMDLSDEEDNMDELMDWFNDDSSDDGFNDSFFSEEINSEEKEEEHKEVDESWKMSYDNVRENSVLNREVLVDMLKNSVPRMNREFGSRKELSEEDEKYQTLEVLCKKAIGNVVNMEIEEIKCKAKTIEETTYSYIIYMDRLRKIKKIEDLEKEINYYARKDSSDKDVSADVEIEGDYFKIVISKGKRVMTSVSDILNNKDDIDKMKSEKYKMPVILGIDRLGNAVISDFATYDSLMISGLARSGKSWYLVDILVSLCAINKPTELQLIIVDPKESNLLKTVGLLPHTASVQNDKYILQLCNELLNKEAPRRKKILEENKVDTIWDLRKKGIEMPIIVFVVDEYITARNNLSNDDRKDFNELTLSMLTQLPSLGIKILLVPHRTVGIVDKTLRSLISFSAAIRAKTADVIDALGIKDWRTPLTNPGDIALKTNDMEEAMYLQGPVLGSSDEETVEVIRNLAKSFYKMGVEEPDSITKLRYGYTRDNIEIFDELGLDKSNLLQGGISEETKEKIGINNILNSI